jgi:outer membrane receptor protein involved in Fe transport
MKTKIVVSSLLACAVASPGFVLSQEQVLEEIVVTGSFIKRDSFDSSVPLTVVDQTDIEAKATPNLGEVLATQTFNYGTDFQTNTYAARGQGGVNSQANLRGLGPRATLNLIDGRRSSQGNLNNALPQIAIQRIDILKDGASALYGSDAVAGAVNIITNKGFEGTQFKFFHNETDDNAWDSNTYEIMTGSATDNGNFVAALSWSESSELQQVERPDFVRGGFSTSGTGNPGVWTVANRDASGAIIDVRTLSAVPDMANGSSPRSRATAARTKADPGCGTAIPGATNDIGVKGNNPTGVRNAAGTSCSFQFGEFWNYMNPQDKLSFWSNFNFEFSDNLSNEFDVIVSRLSTESRGSPQNPGGRTDEFPIVLGTHPGNPFRALNSTGAPLFAQDADLDGIPDRGTTDANGDGINDVLLSATPLAAGPGSIAFNEDVDVVSLRIFSKFQPYPSNFNGDGSNSGNATFDTLNYRFADTLTYAVPNSSWEVSAGLVYQRNILDFTDKNTSQTALIAGLNGNLRATPTDAGFSYWNPFATQLLDCTNRVCSFDGSPGFANTQDVVEAINIEATSVTDTTFYVYDLLARGDLFDLWTGDTVAAAFGYQYRNDKIDDDLDDARNRCDWHEGGCGFDYRASQDVREGFFELLFPFSDIGIGSLDLSLAARYTDYGGSIGNSTDPKVSMLYKPTDAVSIRASWSTAFIAPDLDDQFEPEDCGLQTATDPTNADNVATFRVACVAGNPNLVPETATVWNVGASFDFLDGDLSLGVDYSVYDFEDRIATTTLAQVTGRDHANFLAAGFTPGQPDILTWINDPRSDPNVVRDPSNGVLTRVITAKINAQEMKHAAYDLYARYTMDMGDLGGLAFRLDATLADEYSYDLGTGTPGSAGDGVGFQNEDVVEIPPIPEWIVNGSVSWDIGNHLARLQMRWIDSYLYDFNSKPLQAANNGINGPEQEAITYFDLVYSYTFDGLIGDGSTRVELGVYNLADEFPDPILNLGGIETYLHDIRGRRYGLRLDHSF